ncbi:PQQ-binding-like beta-propeller repeat protein [Verrucomicrobiota bacterium]
MRKTLFYISLLLVAVSAVMAEEMSHAGLIEKLKKSHGLCSIVGVGKDSSSILKDISGSGDLLVHCIALDDSGFQQAQEVIAANKIYGLVSVEKLPVNKLPYRRDLVNFLLIIEPDQVEALGLAHAEMNRVVAPGGFIAIRKDSKWSITSKAYPEEMDEWTHPDHGADGNRLSKDKVIKYPFGYRWNAGLPMNIRNMAYGVDSFANTRGIAITKGRLFTLSDGVFENLGPTYDSAHGLQQYITARDAFNGLLLWRRSVGETHYSGLFFHNKAPFVAEGDRVYAATGEGKLIIIDAATGLDVKILNTAYPPGKIAVAQNRIVVAGWEGGTKTGGSMGLDRRRHDFRIGKGSLEVFDIKSHKLVWKNKSLATSMLIDNGVVFCAERDGPDRVGEMGNRWAKADPATRPGRPKQKVTAYDLNTGKLLWEHIPGEEDAGDYMRLTCAGVGVVVVSFDNGKKNIAISAENGKIIFETERDHKGSSAYIWKGSIATAGSLYDPKTGEIKDRSPINTGAMGCSASHYLEFVNVVNRKGGMNVGKEKKSYAGVRGACLFGSVPAHGALFTPQNWCPCMPSQIKGFISCGPIDKELTTEEMTKPPVVEKGFGIEKNPQSTIRNLQSDWFMYRNDTGRGNASLTDAPEALDLLWKQQLVTLAKGNIARDRNHALTSQLTQPVSVNGIVVVAVSDENRVLAFDRESGMQKWQFLCSGRIDTSPTLCGDVCVFGAHDGYVYALSLQTGKLRWKFRAAPEESRMVSYGQVESVWPVIGSVMVIDGTGYCSSGRTEGSDGGIVVRAFDLGSGKVKWSANLKEPDFRKMRGNDIMLNANNSLQLMISRIDPETGAMLKNVSGYILHRNEQAESVPSESLTEIGPTIGMSGFICSYWHRTGDRIYQTMGYGNVRAHMLSWNSDYVAAISSLGHAGNPEAYGKRITLHPRSMVKPAQAERFTQNRSLMAVDNYKWVMDLPGGYQATSIMLCGDSVLTAGGFYKGDKSGGFIQVHELENGKVVIKKEFDQVVAYNGVALAGGKLLVSFEDGSVACMGVK